jgi:nucleoside-diphosphate-sugar epimerase
MSFTSKKVLVVGGAGFIGSVLVQELLEKGYAVKVFDRLYFGDQGLKEVEDRIELVIGDMRTLDPAILDDVEAVINLGGLSNDPTAEYNPEANYQMNTVATEKLAILCKEKSIKRHVFASSCSTYYSEAGNERDDMLLDEDAEINPKAAYSSSKFQAERKLLAMVDEDFCPVILRKGTVFGFSPRMRYDLVVNTFLRDALHKGYVNLHFGGEMWRPLIEVRDVARAYIACIEADEEKVKGEIFNLSTRNYRISELALHVKEVLRESGITVDIKADYRYKGVRSYRVSTEKIEKALGFRPSISIEESIKEMIDKINSYGYTDFDSPKYYNIRWMKFLEEAENIIKVTGSVFEL